MTNKIEKRRGIQPGQNVGEGAPRLLEGSLRRAVDLVLNDPQVKTATPLNYSLHHVKGVTREELHEILSKRGVQALCSDTDLIGYSPDGGIFVLVDGEGNKTHLLSSEAKHQQNAGNAIERWYKNYVTSTLVAPRLACVVFASGAGACKSGQIGKTLMGAFLDYSIKTGYPVRSFNRGYLEGPSFFMNPEGFTDHEMADAIKFILLKQLSIHNMR